MPVPTPPPDPDDSLPEFEDRAKPFLIRAGLVLTLLIVLAFSIKPVFRSFKKQRGLTAADQAEALMLQQRRDEAEVKLKEALALNPNQPRLLRLAAQFYSKLGQPDALGYWQRLLASPEATRDDRQGFVDFALSLNHLDTAAAELEAMMRLNPTDTATQRLLLRLHLQRDDLAAALVVARSLLDQQPTDEEAQFTLGKLLIRHTQPDSRTEGRRYLSNLALGLGPHRDPALELLLSDRDLDPKEATLLLKTLEARAGRSLPDRLKVASLRLRVEPARRAEVITALLRSGGTAPPAGELLQLAEWLDQQGETTAIVTLLTPERVQGNGALLNARLLALVALDQPEEVRTALADSASPLDPGQRDLLRAALAARAGQPAEAERELLKVIAASGSDASRLLAAVSVAERLNQPAAAIAAHEKLLDQPAHGVASARAILRLLDTFTDVKSQQATVHRLATSVPGFKSLAADDAYLRLLLADNIADARATLVTLAAQNPRDTRLRTSLALAEVLSKNHSEALSLLEAEPIDWAKAPPRSQAIYVAVLAANGKVDDARAWAKQVDLSRLKPEEQELVRAWR